MRMLNWGRWRGCRWLGAGLLAWGLGGCTDDHACAPGDSKACVGPESCRGYQVCNADGTAFGACDCSSGAGGAGGDSTGGAGSGGVAGAPVGGTSGIGASGGADASAGVGGSDGGGTGGTDGGGTGGVDASAGAGGIDAGGTGGADASAGDGGGTGGASDASAGTGGADAGLGTACAPTVTCWNKTAVGAGSPNKAFVDKNGKLYVGDSALGYFTNASGTWTAKALNSDKWGIDENGNPQTVRFVGPPAPLAKSGLVYSKLVNGTWTSEDIPEVDGCECPVTPPCAWLAGPSAVDIIVESTGAPHVIWNDFRSPGCGPGLKPFPMHSYPNSGVWVTEVAWGGWLENNSAEPGYVAGVMDGAYLIQAFVANSLRVPWMISKNPAATEGALYTEGEASGQIVLAKPPGLPIHALFSGWRYDEFGPNPTLFSVILTQDVAQPKQPNAKTTLLSCPGETAQSHALSVTSTGVVRAAWRAKKTDQIRYATNESGAWAYSDFGVGTGVEIAVTPTGEVNVFVGQNGTIYALTPCK
ncbi:MAG: hypothetical protein R3B13_22950 [Polyangiaceae bacterium]